MNNIGSGNCPVQPEMRPLPGQVVQFLLQHDQRPKTKGSPPFNRKPLHRPAALNEGHERLAGLGQRGRHQPVILTVSSPIHIIFP